MNTITDLKSFMNTPRTKKSGWLPISTRSDGTPLGLPVTVITGTQPNPVLLVEACCHGDETEGAVAVVKLIKDVSPDTLKGTLVAIPVVNTRAYETGTRGNPDERYNYDMNRLFPGNASGSISERSAHTYFNKIVREANCVVSLHGGGALFYLINRVMVSNDPKSIELAKAMGPDWTRLHESKHPGTLLNECGTLGIPSVIAELGGVNHRLPEDFMQNVEAFVKVVKNIMRHLGMISGTPEYAKEWEVLEGSNMRCNYGGLIVFGEKCRLKQQVKKGDYLYSIVDLFGEELERVTAPQDGIILGVPGSPVAYPGNNVVTLARVARKIS